MKKRAIGIILTAALLLAGCGGGSKVIEGEVKAKGGDKAVEAVNAGNVEQAEAKKAKEISYKGYVFIDKDVVVEIDAEAAPILEKLGEANSYFESPSCAFEGIDKKYTYGSFELDTYPTNGKDFVSGVIFKDDSITTPEGVGIGDSREKMIEAYGDKGNEELGMTVYKKDGMKLCFVLNEDSIIAIEYKTTLLDE